MPITVHPLLASAKGLRGIPIDQAVVERLRKSFRVVETRAEEFTDRTFEALFRINPDTRRMFPDDLRPIGRSVMEALSFIVLRLGEPEVLASFVRAMGRRHAAHGVQAAHYLQMRKAMVESMRHVSGPAWSEALSTEWGQALDLIGIIMHGAGEELSGARNSDGATTLGVDTRVRTRHPV